MKIQYASDLHLEFRKNKKFIDSFADTEPLGDILVLAGDIMNFCSPDTDFLKWCSVNFKDTYYVPGNHEYYGSDISFRSGSFKESLLSNVYLVNNTSVLVEDVNLVFSTLWSNLSVLSSLYIGGFLSDFKAIRSGKNTFSTNEYNYLHQTALAFIKTEIDNIKGKTVFVTHHCPTFKCINPIHKESMFNDGFHTELTDLIDHGVIGPDYWIYGHNHYNVPEFEIGMTKLITNQCGYVPSEEQNLFKFNKIIEL